MQVLNTQKPATLQQQREARFNAKLRLFLERYGYRDGVAWVQWGMVGGKLQGVFGTTDRKVFDYSIDGEGLGYKPSPAMKADALNRGIRLGVRSDSRGKKKQCTSPTAYACGNACISRTKQCRIRDVGVRQVAAQLIGEARQIEVGRSGGAISEAQLRSVLRREEDKIRSLPYERGLIVDPKTGRVLVDKGGAEAEVFFSPEESRKLKGSVLTHNHPNIERVPPTDPRYKGYSFSNTDVQTACVFEVQEVRAVSVGYDHSLKPPAGGWNSQFWRNKVLPSYQRRFNEVYFEQIDRINRGRTTIAQAEVELWHQTWTRVAVDTGMKYSRVEVNH